MMAVQNDQYIPALSKGWLTPLYDPIVRLIIKEEELRLQFIKLAGPQPGEHILDVGCGTGTLNIMMQKYQPAAIITGLDGDEKILEIARQKAFRAGLPKIQWDQGMSYELPYPDSSFDLVVSSLMIHHLTTPNKLRTFQEVLRVLKPGGRFILADIGVAQAGPTRLIANLMSHMEQVEDNFKGRIPGFLQQAGFARVQEIKRLPVFFGIVAVYRGERSSWFNAP